MIKATAWRRWTLLVVLAAALLMVIGPNVAAAVVSVPQVGSEPWRQRLLGLGLVRGRTAIDVAWDEPVTRAEFVTLIVRAFGKAELARALTGTDTFPDVRGHWASGYIAVAKGLAEQRGAIIGMPDGSFRPDAQVTVPETVAFVMKYVNVPPAPDLSWPENYLTGATIASMLRAEDMAVIKGLGPQLASRGLAFYLADWVFYHFKVAEGGTVYTTYVDTVKPTLTIDSFTVDVAARNATVTGISSEAVVNVSAGPAEVSAAVKEGRYTATLPWDAEQSAVIVVRAQDLAGNVTEQSLKQSRPACIKCEP